MTKSTSSDRNPGRRQRSRQKLLVLVDLAQLRRLLVADAGLDHDRMLAGAHDNRIQAEQDAVLLIGRSALLPERLGHHAEHGAAIELVSSIRADGQLEVAKLRPRAHQISDRLCA